MSQNKGVREERIKVFVGQVREGSIYTILLYTEERRKESRAAFM